MRSLAGERLAGCVDGSELQPVAKGLLEVVAHDLVALDQIGAPLVQPAGEALVQRCARRLRQPVVGGVPDQQVTKPVRVVAGQRRTSRPHELLPYECHQAGVDLELLGPEREHGAAVEDLALDRSALEHTAVALLELVEPRRE
ncbi:MAG TPA: hypothetical protein DCP25_03050 [Chloroflexi bacterium]|nr:hypothetical protein [Chloroflexota bacterium]